MPRALKDWLTAYLEYTAEQESPEKLHLWTGFSMISTALRRGAFMDRTFYKLYPNIYVLIVAESARVRKSVAMEIGLRLLQDSVPEARVITGAVTPEGLIKHLNKLTVEPNPNDPTKPLVRKDSSILVYADEAATLFTYERGRASRMAILLTEIYSSKAEHPHTTARDGHVVLYNLYPTFLAATDPRNLKVLPEEAVGGFIGRTIFVTARERRKAVAWPERGENDEELRKKLQADLFRISCLRGLFEPTVSARQLFRRWYEEQANIQLEDPRLDAFHERCHDTALKLAMLISASRSDSLVVESEHMAGGIAFIEQQMNEFSRVVNWAGSSAFQQNRAKFIDTLRRNGGLATRKVLIKALGISADEFSLLRQTLVEEETVTEVMANKEFIYRLSPDEMGKQR